MIIFHFDVSMQTTHSSPVHPEEVRSVESKLTVAVRVRPLLESELRFGSVPTLTVVDSTSIIIRDDHDFIGSESPNHRYRRSSKTARMFSYDCVFDENANQELVFERTALPLIDVVLHGVNACVFASGATGSGKTYTMLGESGVPGIMTLSLHELFARLEESDNFNIRCSFIEVYNEVIKDLLRENNMASLDIREDARSGLTYIQGVTEVDGIRHFDDMMSLLQVGNRRRTTEPTAANETSSRSHAVLQVTVEQFFSDGSSTVSKLSMVDLAGSERAKDTRNRGLRFIEGGNINKSLLALGNCIKALASKDPQAFIPYRDSKLTRLLKDSLGGNCRTVMIANVSPSVFNFTDSLNTLNFANRAKNIKVRVKRNMYFENSESEIRKYVSMIQDLEQVVENLQRQLAERPLSPNSSEEYIMYTDDDSDDSSSGSPNEEWVIKNQLMDNISDQLKIRSRLAQVEQQLASDPTNVHLETEKYELVSKLKLVSDKSDLLQRSMSNLNLRRRSVTPETSGWSNLSRNAIEECCSITRRMLGAKSQFQSSQTGLLRTKSTRALVSPHLPDDHQQASESVESKLAKLRDDLIMLEGANTKTQFIDLCPPISPPGVVPWQRTDPPVVRKPLRVHNDIPKLSLQPVSSSARSKSSGPIQFN